MPVKFVAEAFAQFSWTCDAEVQAQFRMAASGACRFGASYTSGQEFERIADHNFAFSPEYPTLSASANTTAGVTVTPSLFVDVAYIGGPVVQVPITGQVTVKASGTLSSSGVEVCGDVAIAALFGINLGARFPIVGKSWDPRMMFGPVSHPLYNTRLCYASRTQAMAGDTSSAVATSATTLYEGFTWYGVQTWSYYHMARTVVSLQLVDEKNLLFILVSTFDDATPIVGFPCSCITLYEFDPSTEIFSPNLQYSSELPGCSSCGGKVEPATFEGKFSADLSSIIGFIPPRDSIQFVSNAKAFAEIRGPTAPIEFTTNTASPDTATPTDTLAPTDTATMTLAP